MNDSIPQPDRSSPGGETNSDRHEPPQMLTPVLIGTAVGMIAAWWMSQVGKSFLYELDSGDLVTWFLTALVLIFAAAIASWLPARRAAKIDPMAALRSE